MAKPEVRLAAVQAVFALGLLLVMGRAVQVQIIEGREHAAQSVANRTERVELPAPRGAIFDRNGVPLAQTQEVYHVGVAPNELRDVSKAVALLATQLRLSPRAIRQELKGRWAYFHGPFSAAAVRPLRSVRGIHVEGELERFYPNTDLARTVLGRPTAPGRAASGIEREFDSLLTGVDGRAVVLRDRSGRTYESPSRLDAFPQPGHSLYLTIDAELQEIVEQALADGVDRLEAAGGDVVAVRPTTGEVLAVASVRSSGDRTAGAFVSAFEPGSTAKIFAVAGLLTRGLATPSERIYAERGRYVTQFRVIEDDNPREWLTLREVIAHSSNIGMVKFASRLTPADQFTTLRDFGFGTPTGLEVPSESRGTLRRPDQWSGTTAASVAMGYELAVTPLQLALAYAAIANGGRLLRPTLVREIRDPTGRVTYRHQPEPVRQVVSAEIARDLRSMLQAVVYGGGTGETAALSTYEVAGKTGTARRVVEGRGYVEGSYIASFASLFPADDPQLAMVVKIDDPRAVYSRYTAAPVTKEVLERLLGTQSSVLDGARLARAPVQAPAAAHAVTEMPATTVAWPRVTTPAADSMGAVPDVVGLTMREAGRALHRAGFRVRVEGWGRVSEMTPNAGSRLARGSLVTIAARGAAGRE